MIFIGLFYQPPPPLPANYIPRVQLLDTITKAVMGTKVDPTVSTTVTLQGFGGFGKSALAIGLCHHHEINRHFLDGILWIKLGPKPPNPEMMMQKLYDQLTNENLQQSNFSMEDKLRWYVSSYLKRLLVIIDDVWAPQDALIYVTTFSSCKIVLTTRKSDISTEIPTKNLIKIEEMSIEESKTLLTHRVVDTQIINSSATKMLETLAQDLLRWPLLLGLVRNQLHSQIKLHTPLRQAIKKVQQTLCSKGLTAFDPNMESRTSKDKAVKACVDATLVLLTEKELSNLKILVLYAGTGVSIPKSSLPFFWNDKNIDENLEKLLSCGLITMGRMPLPPSTLTLSCVEMHAVVTQYLVDSMNFGTYKQIYEGMTTANLQLMDWGFGSDEILEDLEPSFHNIDFEDLQSDEKKMASFQLQTSIGCMDNLGIPISIQRVVIFTKIIQQGVVETLDIFSEGFKDYPQLLSLLTRFKTENPLKFERTYMHFIRAYNKIKSFLNLDNYAGVMSALKEYLQKTPFQSLADNFSKLVQELKKNCKEDDSLLTFIKENTAIDYEISNESLFVQCVSCFEQQIRTRFALIKLNKPNITMDEYSDTMMDIMFAQLDSFNAIMMKNPKFLDQFESFDPNNNDDKASFDALVKVFSNIFERLPDAKQSMAGFFNINESLPSHDFILTMMKKYAQTTPRTK